MIKDEFVTHHCCPALGFLLPNPIRVRADAQWLVSIGEIESENVSVRSFNYTPFQIDEDWGIRWRRVLRTRRVSETGELTSDGKLIVWIIEHAVSHEESHSRGFFFSIFFSSWLYCSSKFLTSWTPDWKCLDSAPFMLTLKENVISILNSFQRCVWVLIIERIISVSIMYWIWTVWTRSGMTQSALFFYFYFF